MQLPCSSSNLVAKCFRSILSWFLTVHSPNSSCVLCFRKAGPAPQLLLCMWRTASCRAAIRTSSRCFSRPLQLPKSRRAKAAQKLSQLDVINTINANEINKYEYKYKYGCKYKYINTYICVCISIYVCSFLLGSLCANAFYFCF